MQNLQTLEECTELEVAEQVHDTGVMSCAIEHIQRFESPDVCLSSEPNRRHGGSVVLLPPIKVLRGAPSLGPKGKVVHDVSNPQRASYTVLSDAAFFGDQFRAPTVRFFSIFAQSPSGEQMDEIAVTRTSWPRGTSKTDRAVLANIERTIFHPVSQGCMMQSGVSNQGSTDSPETWNFSWGGRWADEELARAQCFHRVNHFPGTWHIGRKDNLAAGLLRCSQRHPAAFSFHPRTYFMPYDMPLLKKDLIAGGVFIAKPPASARGKGIFLFKDSIPQELASAANFAAEQREARRTAPTRSTPTNADSTDDANASDDESDEEVEQYLVQQYVQNPLLVNGYKWDLRIYALCTAFEPLTVYIFNDGLVRFATEPFTIKNVSKTFCHLTNFSVNKESGKYVQTNDPNDDGSGSKWTLHALRRYFASQGWDWDTCWSSIEDVIVKTFISCEEAVTAKMRQFVRHHHTCFELYGFDVLIDDAFKPHLIEVNVMPSLGCGTALDKHVKGHMIADMLTLVGIPIVSRTRSMELLHQAKERKAHGDTTGVSPIRCNNTALRSIKGRDALSAFAFPDAARRIFPVLEESDKALLRDCEEELRRCGGWTRVIPSPTTAVQHGPLFARRSYYNLLLWLWEAEKQRMTEEQKSQAVAWLRGDAQYPVRPLQEKKKNVLKPLPLPRVSRLPPRSADRVASMPPPASRLYTFVKVERPAAAESVEKAVLPIKSFSFAQIVSRPH